MSEQRGEMTRTPAIQEYASEQTVMRSTGSRSKLFTEHATELKSTLSRTTPASPQRHAKARCHGNVRTDFPRLSTMELLRACLQSEQNAWHEFVDRFEPFIACVVRKTIGAWRNPHSVSVEDLVQETFLKLCANNFKALRDFDCRHEYGFQGFLKAVASHVVQDYLRTSSCQKRGSGKIQDDLDESVPAKSLLGRSFMAIEREVLLRQIQAYMERQSTYPTCKRDCEIFWLYYESGLTAQEISELPEFGLSVKGVESVLFRLVHTLKMKLGCESSPDKIIASKRCPAIDAPILKPLLDPMPNQSYSHGL